MVLVPRMYLYYTYFAPLFLIHRFSIRPLRGPLFALCARRRAERIFAPSFFFPSHFYAEYTLYIRTKFLRPGKSVTNGRMKARAVPAVARAGRNFIYRPERIFRLREFLCDVNNRRAP